MTNAETSFSPAAARRMRPEERIASILQKQNLIPLAQLLRQGLRIVATRRDRATTATVHLGEQGIYLVKLGSGSAREWNRREIENYEALQTIEYDVPIAPGLAYSSPGEGVLVTELLDPAVTMFDYFGQNSFDNPQVLNSFANVLASLHLGSAHGGLRVSSAMPWMLSQTLDDGWDEQLYRLLPEQHARSVAIARITQAQAVWRETCLIHGDLKWDNCILLTGSDGSPLDVRLVDWELSGLGDPAWDVATAVQEFLQHTPNFSTREYESLTQLFASEAGDAIAYLCEAYFHAAELTGTLRWDFLRRCELYTGCRLLQTTIELESIEGPDGPRRQAALAMALSVFRSPNELAAVLSDSLTFGNRG